MGIAGGLVPSPSALVVLLGAVALGRTVFGVALVLGYGFGMAMTLTAAGLLIVRLRDRTQPALLKRVVGARVLAYTPLATAILVLTVGAALAIRSLTPMV
jgi:ABC-type nickel/cobalt efflux system permease component RcnA